ncbi:dienelactone hydrolase family protein [Paenibacillus sp. P26]|nr:dienelactone hydrolase family protein [Paenibacillus sp. P26]UUZ92308.1 dienelactone hydrolase family protein [Paenibacillus sp. P25]
MFSIQKGSDTAIIVVHEIYGINEHMKSICQSLSGNGFDVLCPDLLGREAPFDYSEEPEAYSYFMNRVGFPRALNSVKDALAEIKSAYRHIFVVGFSVGATAAWLCSEDRRVDGVVGYYGSRVRNFLDISPECPVLLFFPQEEASFQVDESLSALDHKANVEARKLTGRHGFSDPFSAKYDEASANEAFERMLAFLRNDRV